MALCAESNMVRPMNIDALLHEWTPELTAWRRDFHAHPELGFEEHRTAARVAERLAEFGLDVTTGIGGTGVVGTLRCGSGNRAIALRAAFWKRGSIVV